MTKYLNGIEIPNIPWEGAAEYSAGDEAFTVPGMATTTQFNWTLAANVIYYMPIRIKRRTSFKTWGVITAADAGANNIRYGLYYAGRDWQPDALIEDSGSLSLNGVVGALEDTISVTLEVGNYLVAVRSDTTPQLRSRYSCADWIDRNLSSSIIIKTAAVSEAYGAYADPGTAWDTASLSTMYNLYHCLFMREDLP